MRTIVPPVTLDDLTEPWIGDLPWLDRPDAKSHDGLCLDWAKNGYVILRRFLSDAVIDAYTDCWRRCNEANGEQKRNSVMGWPYDVPYMHHVEVRELCCWLPLNNVMEQLIGEPMGVHLNLSGWRSTRRDWHQDGYLNPDTTRDFYCAAWMALDDVHPDSGPFEYIPGSHRLIDPIREQHMRSALTAEEANSPNWPRFSERILTPLFEQLIQEENLTIHQFIPTRGDVLLWHPRLLHRGSVPKDPNLERRSLIAHYSGIGHRPDFPLAQQRVGEGWYFPIHQEEA